MCGPGDLICVCRARNLPEVTLASWLRALSDPGLWDPLRRGGHSARLPAGPPWLETRIENGLCFRHLQPLSEVLWRGLVFRQLSSFAVAKLIPSPQAGLRRIPDLCKL